MFSTRIMMAMVRAPAPEEKGKEEEEERYCWGCCRSFLLMLFVVVGRSLG